MTQNVELQQERWWENGPVFDKQIISVHLIHHMFTLYYCSTLQCSLTQKRTLPSEPAAQPLSAASAYRGQRVAWLRPPTGWDPIGFRGGWQSSGGRGSAAALAGWSWWTWCWLLTETAWCAHPNANPPDLSVTRFESLLKYYWHWFKKLAKTQNSTHDWLQYLYTFNLKPFNATALLLIV